MKITDIFSSIRMKSTSKDTNGNRVAWKKDLLLKAACFAVCLALGSLYISHPVLLFALAAIFFLAPHKGLVRLLAARRLGHVRQQYARFVQDLSVQLSEGMSVERSLQITGASFTAFYGSHDPAAKKVQDATSLLQANIPLSHILNIYLEAFPCPEARSLFVSLKQSLLLGEQTLKLLRAASRMSAELSNVLREAQQMSARQNTEAIALAALPPLMLFILAKSSPAYFAPAFESTPGQIMLIAAYILSVISAAVALSYSVAAQPQEEKAEEEDKEIRLAGWVTKSHWCKQFGLFYQRILPRSYRSSLAASLMNVRASLPRTEQKLLDRRQLTMAEIHFLWKLPLLIAFFLLSALLSTVPQAGPWSFLSIPVILIVHDISRIQSGRERTDALKREFPLFLNQTVVLLEAGLLPHRALRIVLDDSGQSKAIKEELTTIFSDMQTGISLNAAIDSMTTRIPVPDIQQALNALSAFAAGGSAESLAVLRMQGSQCWQLARQAVQKDSERVASRMMLPMIFGLLAIILICLAPVISNFQLF